jgi:hypothetical protein
VTTEASTPPPFLPAVIFDSGGEFPWSIAVADVNGDGKPDVVVTNANSNTVGVLLGNGYGWFEPAVTYGSGAHMPDSVALEDVNGDGKLDIVVANGGAGSGCGIGVLLGNGDGTFQSALTYGSSAVCSASSVVVKDVNGDGKPDLLVAAYRNIAVLLGNGDGTFQPAVTYGWGGGDGTSWGAHSLGVADLNHDGIPDLVVASGIFPWPWGQSTVAVLLGNGDGTFQAATNYDSGGVYAFSLGVGDVNGDGKPDLLVVNNCVGIGCSTAGSVGVLLGNGDGTFQAPVTYDQVGGFTISVVLADMDLDGKSDLVVSNLCISINNCSWIAVQKGNGDGTFQPAAVYHSHGLAWSVAVADVNTDGNPDLLVTNVNGGPDSTVGVLLHNTQRATSTSLVSSLNPSTYGEAVTFTAKVTSRYGKIPDGGSMAFYDGVKLLGLETLASGMAAFTTSSLSGRMHGVTAIYTGDNLFTISQGEMKQIVEPLATTTTLASSLNPSNLGQVVTFTATVTSAGPTPTGKMKFMDGTTSIGSATLSSSVAKLTKSTLAVGTHPITAQYLGDAASGKSTSVVLNQVVQ